MRAMILAAGRGQRMRPLTDNMPKPLLPVNDKPLIEYHIEALSAAGIHDIMINLAWQGAALRTALGDGSRFGVTLHYSDEGDYALETGGGVFNVLSWFGAGPFIVVSGDVWTDYPLATLGAKLRGDDLAHFVMVPNPDYHERGDFGLDGDRIVDREPRLTYANLAVLRPEFFANAQAGRFALAPLMFEWSRAGRVSGELYKGQWFNVGTPQQLEELDARLRARR